MPDRGKSIAVLEDYRRRFALVRFGEIKADRRRTYIVKDLIPRGGLIVVWGPPKCGKSFWVSDLALHVALDWPYRGRRIEAGAVVYVTCEGQSGFPARIEAFRCHKLTEGACDPPFYLLPTRLDLVADVEMLVGDIKAQLGRDAPVLIVIDTLNRSLAGSESKDEDMSAYVQACDRIREAFECAVLVVHHCGVEANRPRGHTSLTGAVDAQIAVERDKDENIVALVEFMKDGPEGDRIVCRLEVVEVGLDEDGDPVTSCVIVPTEAAAKPEKKTPTGQAGIALMQLRNAIADAGQPPPNTTHFPAGRLVVPLPVWRGYCKKGGLAAGDNEETFKKAWQRGRDSLLSGGYVRICDDFVWLVNPEGDTGT